MDTLGTGVGWGNAVYAFDFTFAHSAEAVVIEIVNGALEGAPNEGLGVLLARVTDAHVDLPPVVDAGADQVVPEGVLVTLLGSASDADGPTFTLEWTQTAGDPVLLSATNVAQPTFTAPPVGAPTTFTFVLTLTQGATVLSDAADVLVNPVASPDAPCPWGQGFWKNHPASWPVGSLTLGATSFGASAAMDVLKTPPKGDARLILGHQLIAAKLNLAAGVADSATPGGTSASQVVAAADGELVAHGGTLFADGDKVRTSSPAGREMTRLAGILDAYNAGTYTPGCA